MGKVLKETILSVKRASGDMLLFEVIFRIITSLCLIPGFVLLFDILLRFTGYSYITKNNIHSILKNPVLLAFFAASIILTAFIMMIEISALTVFFGYNLENAKFRIKSLVFLGLKEFRRLLNPVNTALILYAICIIPVINFIPIGKYIFGNREILNFISYNIARLNGFIPILAVLAAGLFILNMQMIFVFCYFFLEHKNLRQAFSSSKKLIKGRIIRTVAIIAGCKMFFLLIYVLFYLLIIFLVQLGTDRFYEQRIAYALFLTIFNMINKVLVVVLGMFESLVSAGLIVNLYFRYSGKCKKECPAECIQTDSLKKTRLNPDRIAVSFLAVVFLLTGSGIYLIINEDYSLLESNKTDVTAHRGASGMAPENTLTSIEAAIDAMADYVEIDVRQTRDGVVVVFHDKSLERIAGVEKNIGETDYSEIEYLDVGRAVSEEFAGETIPTLEEVIQYSKGRIKLNIEIKKSPGDQELEEEIVRLIEENGMEDSCAISSFAYESLMKIKELNKGIRTGFILSNVYGRFYDLKYVDFFSVKRYFVTEKIVTEIHKRGKEIHVWTVNDRYNIESLTRIGVDNIITDDPVKARTVIYSANFPKYTTNFLKMVFHY